MDAMDPMRQLHNSGITWGLGPPPNIAEAISVGSPTCSERPKALSGMWGRTKKMIRAAAAATERLLPIQYKPLVILNVM